MSERSILTSNGTILDQQTGIWIERVAEAIRNRCGEQPVLRMYAYRNNRVEYLAMDFHYTKPAPRRKVHGIYSITMSVHSADKVSLDLPQDGVFEMEPSVTNWVDALTLASLLCRKLDATMVLNAA